MAAMAATAAVGGRTGAAVEGGVVSGGDRRKGGEGGKGGDEGGSQAELLRRLEGLSLINMVLTAHVTDLSGEVKRVTLNLEEARERHDKVELDVSSAARRAFQVRKEGCITTPLFTPFLLVFLPLPIPLPIPLSNLPIPI